MINRLFQFLLICAFSAPSMMLAQPIAILPNTVYCVKGTNERPAATFCADSTPCKVVNGVTACLQGTPNPPAGATILAGQTCWSQNTDYTCFQYQNSCQAYYSDANCKEVESQTCTLDADGKPMLAVNSKTGACASYTRTFTCADPRKPKNPSYTVNTQCDVTGLQNGLEWKTNTKSNASDFVAAVTGQEFARQLATYASKDIDGVGNLFKGESMSCKEGYGGLKSCCKSKGGGNTTNRNWATGLGFEAGRAAFTEGAGYAVAKGSAYVYDSLLSSGSSYLNNGMMAMLDEGIFNTWGAAGFGAYGIGTTASAAGGFAFGSHGSVAISNTGIYFNPYALALAVAIQVVMEVISCEQREKDLANARTQGLCRFIGSYCSTEVKILGKVVGCLETTQAYCCFNGLMAKGLQEGARQQLGIGWGTPKNPQCQGLSVTQLTSLNFDAPEMQEAFGPMKQQIMDHFNANMGKDIANGSITNNIAGNLAGSEKLLCEQRKKLDPNTVCK